MEPLMRLEEPLTHTCSSHWRQYLLCEDYSLTEEELRVLLPLKRQSNVMFEDNPRWDLLKLVYTEYFQAPPQTQGREWMKLGFQGQHPQTDFRGGGVYSLQLILRFLRRNRDLVLAMEKDKENFFFAITAINIAFWMKKYFHLFDGLLPLRDAHVYCNRRALKNFSRILAHDEECFMNMHEMFLMHFYSKIWMRASEARANLLLEFNSLFDELLKCIRGVFEGYKLETADDLIAAWRETAR